MHAGWPRSVAKLPKRDGARRIVVNVGKLRDVLARGYYDFWRWRRSGNKVTRKREGEAAMRALFALFVLLLLTSCASAQVNSIGYIGCSNSHASVEGYHHVSGNKDLLWPAYASGAGRIDYWADNNSSYWTNYDGMVVSYGQPKKVWVQLCEAWSNVRNNYAQVQQMLTNLRQHSPNADAVISAINVYNPFGGLCYLMGPQGQGENDTDNWRDKAVADKLAWLGPSMGPLTESLVIGDGCHPNVSGKLLLGGQLHSFFDH
jgi:hypothetical protein